MPSDLLAPRALTQAALDLMRWLRWLVLIGFGLVIGALAMPTSATALAVLIAGLSFAALAILVQLISASHRRREAGLVRTAELLVEHDSAPCFVTDVDGELRYANEAGQARFDGREASTLVAMLGDLFASPASVLYRLQNRAQAIGSASEDVVLRKGLLRLSVHRVGADHFLWRFEERDSAEARSGSGRSGETIGLPMLTVSKSGTILFMNEALRRMLGGRETTLDRVFTDLPLKPGEVHQVLGAHGREHVLVTEVPLSGGRREIYLLSEPKLRVADTAEWGGVERLPVPLLSLAEDGTVKMANERARDLLGLQSLVGLPFADLVEGLGRPVGDWLAEAWQGRNLGRTETMRASRTDEERFVQISLEQVSDDTGLSLVAVLTDATEVKSLENQFVQSQKMQAVGQLAGGVAHDFNNLLTAISGHCDLLLEQKDATHPDYADLSQISQNSNRAASLVGQLLAYSRKQTLRPEVIDLNEAMAEHSVLLGRLVGEKVDIRFEHDKIIQPIRADKRQLEQVVMNLVVNARDAMPEGGKITIEASNVYLDQPLERDRVRLAPGDYARIRVVDTGSGIPADKIGRIFEPFFSTKGAKGTGLGLSMAYGIVKQSGGYIFVDSVVGSGTTFSLYFPVFNDRDAAAEKTRSQPDREASGARQERAASSSREEGKGNARAVTADPDVETVRSESLPRPTHEVGADGGIVLLVEDEAPVRAFASRALRLRGFTVLEAESAEDALKTLEDDSIDVDVFVTDVIMPGMDGPTWVSKALKDRPGVKVVFVSGYAEDSVSEHQSRIPNSVFLPKPFSLKALTDTVKQQIH